MRRRFSAFDLNRSVGNLLRIGVILSVITSLFGFIKLYTEGFKMPDDYASLALTGGNVWANFFQSLGEFKGMGIIQLGILILILTPLVRIIFALNGYLKEKDYTYVIISGIVLAIMLFSFLMGFSH